MSTVSVEITRKDLLRFHFATLFRVKANLYLFIIIWAAVFFVIWAGHRDELGDAWTLGSLIASIPTAVGAFTLFFSFLLFFALLGAVITVLLGNIGTELKLMVFGISRIEQTH